MKTKEKFCISPQGLNNNWVGNLFFRLNLNKMCVKIDTNEDMFAVEYHQVAKII